MIGGTSAAGLSCTSVPSISTALPATRSCKTSSAASVRRPRSRRGTPAAAQERSWRSPPTPTPNSSRPPDTCCNDAACFAAHTTGRSGRIITPYPSRSVVVGGRGRGECHGAVDDRNARARHELIDRPRGLETEFLGVPSRAGDVTDRAAPLGHRRQEHSDRRCRHARSATRRGRCSRERTGWR